MDSCMPREALRDRGWRGWTGPREHGRKTPAPFGVFCFQSGHREGDIFTPGACFSSPFPISAPQPSASLFPFLRRGGGVELGRPHPHSAHYGGRSDVRTAATVNMVGSRRSLSGSGDNPGSGEAQRDQRPAQVYQVVRNGARTPSSPFWFSYPRSGVSSSETLGVLSHCWNGSS